MFLSWLCGVSLLVLDQETPQRHDKTWPGLRPQPNHEEGKKCGVKDESRSHQQVVNSLFRFSSDRVHVLPNIFYLLPTATPVNHSGSFRIDSESDCLDPCGLRIRVRAVRVALNFLAERESQAHG